MKDLTKKYYYSLIVLLFAFSGAVFSAQHTTLKTNSFPNEIMLPAVYTCDGENISPQLNWSTKAKNAKSFAVLFKDIDAPKGIFYHWVLFNIPKNVTTLPQKANTPAGAIVGKNSWDKNEYSGPCPPIDETHSYVFTLYALDKQLNLSENADGKAVEAAMHSHILSKAELTTVYRRWKKS